jgi:hypothetical protein
LRSLDPRCEWGRNIRDELYDPHGECAILGSVSRLGHHHLIADESSGFQSVSGSWQVLFGEEQVDILGIADRTIIDHCHPSRDGIATDDRVRNLRLAQSRARSIQSFLIEFMARIILAKKSRPYSPIILSRNRGQSPSFLGGSPRIYTIPVAFTLLFAFPQSIPDGSIRLVGEFPVYRYRFASPAAKPIGAWLIHRPVEESYQRLRLFCNRVVSSNRLPVYPKTRSTASFVSHTRRPNES